MSAPNTDGCWKAIGIYGDASCAQLARYVHCRNCPVYAGAAVHLLDVEVPSSYAEQWTARVAAAKPAPQSDKISLLIFRIAAEWLALPSAIFKEIAGHRLIHSLPHRRNGALLGIVNIRGELLVCTSLKHILGVDDASAIAVGRMLVIQQDANRTVCPVDEVHGIERFPLRDMQPVPATLVRAAVTYSKGVLLWRQRSVGVLDAELLFHTINRSFQSATST